jgi:hypothetical protein
LGIGQHLPQQLLKRRGLQQRGGSGRAGRDRGSIGLQRHAGRLLRLGGRAPENEGAESCRDARGDVVERAGKGLRTVAVIAEAL